VVRHFGFAGIFWDDPQREFGDLYHCAKFGWNRISRLDNTSLNILSVWPENAYSHPFFVLGVNIGENGNFLHCYS